MSAGSDIPDNLVALSRFRAALAKAHGKRLVEELLAEDNARALVQSVPPLELYYAIQEVGLADCHELLPLATIEQIQSFITLDAWQGDTLDSTRAWRWLSAIAEGGFERLHEVLDQIDPEMLALLIQREVRVWDLTEEEVPDSLENAAWESPDRFFLVELLSHGDRADTVRRLFEDLYRANLGFARNLLMAARYETKASLEEESYRLARGRLEDLGFPPGETAQILYQPIDLASVKIGENSAEPLDEPRSGETAATDVVVSDLPVIYADPLRSGSFLADALATIQDDRELRRLFQAIVYVSNQSMVASRVAPGDPAAVRPALKRAIATVSLGLEFVAQGSQGAKAREALATVSLRRLFRVGATLGFQLKVIAQTLAKGSPLGRSAGATDLLDPPYDAVFSALFSERASYALALDGGAGGAGEFGERPFSSVADIRRTANAIAEVRGLIGLIADGLGLDPTELPSSRDDLRLHALLGNICVRAALGIEPSARPLSTSEISRFRSAVLTPDPELTNQREKILRGLSDAVNQRQPKVSDRSPELHVADSRAAIEIHPLVHAASENIANQLRTIAQEFSRLSDPTHPDPRYIASVWLDSYRQES